MDLSASTSTQRVARPEPPQPSSGRSSRSQQNKDKGDGNGTVAPAPSRQPRSYKEKFNTLKEKFDLVTATRDRYNKELAVANDKLKKLENECNLLLDAVDIAAPSQPSILHFLTQDPIPAQYHLTARGALPPPMQLLPENGESQRPMNGTNGHHDYGRVNPSVW